MAPLVGNLGQQRSQGDPIEKALTSPPSPAALDQTLKEILREVEKSNEGGSKIQ